MSFSIFSLSGNVRPFSCRWFNAEESFGDLVAWATDLAAASRPRWHALDVFGASQKVTTTWIREGMAATAFDIKITRKHDICTSEGCKELVRMGIEFLSCVEIGNVLK